LQRRFHVIRPDVRGAGASDRPTDTASYRIEHLIGDLGAVIDATSPSRPVHLVGHDWGSIQSWSALTDPIVGPRIASYTSISGPCLDHVSQWLPRGSHAASRRDVFRQARRSWYVAAFQVPGAGLPWKLGLARRFPKVLERLEGIAPTAHHRAPTLADDARAGIKLYRANVRSRRRSPQPPTITTPVQLLVPLHDPFVTPSLADAALPWCTNLWRREIDAGHWAIRSHASEVAGYVSELVDAVESDRAPVGQHRMIDDSV
ncbi:MAG TPA: alpha/beta fold hydrolase, partial [Acidimicrobiales bacterium]